MNSMADETPKTSHRGGHTASNSFKASKTATTGVDAKTAVQRFVDSVKRKLPEDVRKTLLKVPQMR
jgi:hypothetical protein